MAATITHYEGFKGWGHWGADVRMEAGLYRGDVKLFQKEIRAFFKYPDDPARSRESARRLLGPRFGILCFGHGEPMTEGAHMAVADLLARDARRKER